MGLSSFSWAPRPLHWKVMEEQPWRVTGVNEVPGPIKDGDSHRCEMAGLCVIVLFTNLLCDHFNITSGSIKMACETTKWL